jgi:phytoene dehydrogenase-like protein
MTEQKYQIIVVGGGIAGLTCAAYLAKGGKKVLLVEKNKECGGLVNSFSRDGFRFEAGVRALENAGIIFPMLQELGIELEVVRSKVSVGVENEILHVEDINSLTEYGKLLKKIYPENDTEIDQLIKLIRKIMKHMDVLYGIENPNFKDLKNDRAYLFKELLPWLPKFIGTIGKINRMNMPVEPYLEQFISNPSLRDIIAQHFFKNTPTFFALSYFSLYLDYFYPKGGVGQLASVVEQKFLELGGEIARETVIEQVLASEQKLMDHAQQSYGYEKLVWAADLKTLYRITDTKGLSAKVLSRIEGMKKRFMEKRGGDSVYTLYLQVDEPSESFKEISNGHFFYTPSRKGLGETHWSGLNKILAEYEKGAEDKILQWLDNYLDLNTYEISIPALRDPDMAPEGKTGLIISILTEYDLFKMVADAGWYKEFISEMEDRIIKVLADSVYPMLRDKIMKRFSFTPLSYANRVGSSEGAITGWSFQEPVPVIHRIQAANRSVLTPIPSVYQAGQWTYSPAGVPMSILTGKLAAVRILKS